MLEVMIAIGIFAMVVTAIYATWMAIIKGSRAAQNAAASVQRSRIAVNALEASFRTVQLFTDNPQAYAFITDTSGDLAAVSMVSRLSPAIPGFGVHRGLAMCRVTFSPQVGPDGGYELVMTHAPMLADTNSPQGEAYSAVLAKDVTLFTLEFWDSQKREYVTEWIPTNQLPQKVVISLGTGKKGGSSSSPQDIVVKEVTIPSAAIAGLQRGGPSGVPVGAGALPPGGGLPGGNLPGGNVRQGGRPNQ